MHYRFPIALILAALVLPTATAAAPVCDRARFHMLIDVGHTIDAPGATSARGAPEYGFNFFLANQIERRLVAAGFTRADVMITPGDKRLSLFARVAHANRSGADLLLSIHHDAVPDAFLDHWVYDGMALSYSDRFKGHSIFVSNRNADYQGSLAFARLLGEALLKRGLRYTRHYTEAYMGRRRRELIDATAGVYRYDQLIVLERTQMPAVLLEAGSIVNRDEELAMLSEERQRLIADAVLDAADAFCALRTPLHPAPVARHAPVRHAAAEGGGR